MKRTSSKHFYRDGRHYDFRVKFVQDIPFWIAQVRKYGDPVLELACGTGRITIPLAKEGFKVSGLDISESMLAEAKKKSEREKVDGYVQTVVILTWGRGLGLSSSLLIRCVNSIN
jgi:2-polyprenyl-3-methyl-5-hydroxy-6-metoxy-1,4-benzoquinol methylase